MRIFLFFVFLLFSFALNSAESINKIYAIIGKISISQLDYEKGEDKFKRLFKQRSPYKGSHKTQVLDFLIERAIVDITADEESITVNEKRIESEIEKMMEHSGITDRAQFEKHLSEKSGMPFEMWVSDLPYQIKKSQLMQMRVTVRPPTEDDAKKWYERNKDKLGYEVKYREIVMIPRNTGLDEERRVSNEMSQIQKEIRKDKSAFNLIASGPRNQSPRGGYSDWISTSELVMKNRTLVGNLAMLPEGGISELFRDDRGRYCIIRMDGKRRTPMEAIRKIVQDIIAREKMDESFMDWVRERRKEVPMFIYDKEYAAENKIETPDESFNFNKIQQEK